MPVLICICGTAYSGSTMLDLMLGSQPNAFSLGEVYAWFRPWRKHHFDLICGCGKENCQIWARLKNVPENQFHEKAFEALSVDYIVDSSKELTWVLDSHKWAIQSGISIVNVVIWKEPVDFAYSIWKRRGSISYWKRNFTGYYGRLLGLAFPKVAVNFGELTTRPKEKLAELCSAIPMHYQDGMERFWEADHHHLFGSDSVRHQSQIGQSRIRSFNGFPEEFKPHIETVQSEIRTNKTIQRIIQNLNALDVSNVHKGTEHRMPSSISCPLWYYSLRMRNRILQAIAPIHRT